MKIDVLGAVAQGVGVMPELSRHFTVAKGGNHITFRLRRREDRKTLGYLPTNIYVVEGLFDQKSKQVLNQETNERLIKLFGRAVSMVADAPHGADYKKLWEQEQARLIGEDRRDKVQRLNHYFEHLDKEERYTALLGKRSDLEKEIMELDAEIEALRQELHLPVLAAVVTRNDMMEFTDTMTKFMNVRRHTLPERDYQMWKSWLRVLNDFATSAGLNLSIGGIDLGFYKEYKAYIMVTRKNTANTFGAHIKRLKSFLKYAEGEGKMLNREAKDTNFKIVEEKKKVVYLSDAELDMLWEYRLVRPTVMKTVHVTLFQSLTGLRISDVAKSHAVVKRGDDDGEREYLTSTCKKNGGTYLIPLSLDNRIKEILIDNSFNMKLMTEQVYNRDVKKILADMYAYYGMTNEEIQVERQDVTGNMVVTTSLKSDLISTHSNRRSFISRHINSREFNHLDILKMLGSSDLKELQKYIDVDDVALNDKAKANARTREGRAMKKRTNKVGLG